MDHLGIHFEAGYFAKVKAIAEMPGIILTLPRNLFLGRDETNIVYEIDRDKVNIYSNKKKIETIVSPEYATRHLVAIDVVTKILNHKLSTKLIRCYDADGKWLEDNKGNVVELILPFKSKKLNKLESTLNIAIFEFHKNGELDELPDEIEEGFLLIVNRYFSKTQEE